MGIGEGVGKVQGRVRGGTLCVEATALLGAFFVNLSSLPTPARGIAIGNKARGPLSAS